MQTLTNSFHNTECKTRFSDGQREDLDRIAFTGHGEEQKRAVRAVRRIWKKLCGIKGCTCGNSFGER